MSTQTVPSDFREHTGASDARSSNLPITQRLTFAYVASSVIALLMLVTSVFGLVFRADVYPTDDLIRAFWPVDLFHLVIGLPTLLGAMGLARRGRLIGLLCWPGALLYVQYSYITNLAGVPFDVLFLPYLLLVTLSAYTSIGLVASIDGEAVRQRLGGAVPVKAAGGFLVGLTGLFLVMIVSEIVTALADPRPGSPPDNVMVWIADFTTVIPTCLVGGVLLWRRKALGYVGGAGLLLMYSLLLLGLIPVLLFPAFYDASPVNVADVVSMFGAGLVCLALWVRFARGVASVAGPLPPGGAALSGGQRGHG